MLSYGRHIVFLMESRIPLRSDKGNKSNENSMTKKPKTTAGTTGSSAIRLKGQMKWISGWNMIVFLCHPVYVAILLLFFNIIREQ
jgi:hypothetical protein